MGGAVSEVSPIVASQCGQIDGFGLAFQIHGTGNDRIIDFGGVIHAGNGNVLAADFQNHRSVSGNGDPEAAVAGNIGVCP